MKLKVNGYLLGAAAGAVALLAGLLIVFWIPSGAEQIKAHMLWIQFAAYTIVIFAWMVQSLRPANAGRRFWGMVSAAMIIHTAALAAFIHYVRPLGPVHYIVFGPIEGFAIALIFERRNTRRVAQP